MKNSIFSLIALAALLTGCAKKEEVPTSPPEGTGAASAPKAPTAASQNGGAAFGPDGKPLTGAGK
ncbi:hypothetical protein [Armatimonas sp.]|uniref:hypothetical protein n=1 Tax=Armatimonas sp. TaxID=1872638 RepID=UPI0037508B38